MPSNLTTGQVLPGFYGYVDYNTNGGGQTPTRRALLWGYIGPSAQYTPNVPRLPASQQEADDGASRGSELASAYASAASQPEAQGAEVWVLPITATSGNVASTYKLKVYISTIAKSGTIKLFIDSQPVPEVGFTTTDTASTIASALRDAIASMKDLPLGSVTVATDTVTIPYQHKGADGEDFPIRCNISPNGTGVQLSPGQALFNGTASGANGSIKFTFGALSVSTPITSGDTAPTIAANVSASFNADTYPLYAAVDTNTSQVDLFFTNDRDVRRISGTIFTSGTTTVDLGSGAAPAASTTYNGTQGVGAPNITAALTNLAGLGVYRSWAAPWLDTTTVSSMATFIENASDGSISGQKQSHLTLTDYRASSVAGALAPATSPNLTTTAPHYAVCWAPDSAITGMGVSARVAAARAAKWLDTPQFNWNGFQLKGSSRSPILLPPSVPSELTQNAALRTYALAPVVAGHSGNMEIVKGRTTSLAADKRLWAWSTEAQAAYHAVDLAIFYRSLFQGGSLVRFTEPKSAGIFDAFSFTSATQERMRFWERAGNYDGADKLAPAVKSAIDGNNPFRVNVEYPESPVLDLDQVVFTSRFSQPSV